MAPVRARLPNARTLKQKAADPRVDRLVHEDGERGKTSAGGTGSDPRVAPQNQADPPPDTPASNRV